MAERRPKVRVTMVARACVDCARTGLDVIVDRDQQPRCYPGLGCQAKLYRATGSARRA